MMINPIGLYTAQAVSTASSKPTTGAETVLTAAFVTKDAAVTQTSNGQSSTVTISGRALMLSRLFHTQDANAQPSVASVNDGTNQNPVAYLTEKDRTLVSDMYAYAQQQGSDLQHVDSLAITLGMYRQGDNGNRLGGFNEGEFDSQGHQLTSNYSVADTATANQILNGDAIKSTRLDSGFMNFILKPTNSLLNGANMEFMGQMVTKFSDKGTDAMTLDPKFATFTRKDSAVNNVVITASKEVVYQAPKSQIANINGHWVILDESLWKNPAALKSTGLSSSQIAEAKGNAGLVSLALRDVDPTRFNDSLTTKLLELLDKINAFEFLA